MKTDFRACAWLMAGAFLSASPCLAQDAPSQAVATSPDGQVRITISAYGDKGLRYDVTYHGKTVVAPSQLGVVLLDGSAFGDGPVIDGVRRRTIDETYTQHPGKRRQVVHRGEEVVVTLHERATPARRWELLLRAYDDGVAFRYRLLGQEGKTEVAISGEKTEFRLPADTLASALPLPGFISPHEGRYRRAPLRDLPDSLLGLPLLAERPGKTWVALAEANLTNYAGMYVARDRAEENLLKVRLSPRLGEPKVAVHATLPHDSPWRVILVSDRLERLVESDLILNLNEPCALRDTSWIKTGKTTFPWWNGFFEEKGTVPFRMGLNTETAKYYIDFCAEAGIPYHSLDGLDNIAWYGGTIVPYQGTNITRGLDGLDLQEVLRHAAKKGVRIRIWMHWQAAEKHMARAFPLYKQWGVEGVMLDFMDRDDQEMVRFLRKAIETAAANQLTVTLHGVSAPTGLERTYPNLLTQEGVMNLEYDKWDAQGITADHELMIPFTRMLAGPLDFHQGSLRGVPAAEFRPRDKAPLVVGTPTRMLASYVVYQNHLPMAADYPSAYRGNPLLPLLVAIPTTWDDTRCLAAQPGELAVMARKQGEAWWVGAMGGRTSRAVEVPLAFLGPGRFRAELVRDDAAKPSRFERRVESVLASDAIRATLDAAGGLLIHLTPER